MSRPRTCRDLPRGWSLCFPSLDAGTPNVFERTHGDGIKEVGRFLGNGQVEIVCYLPRQSNGFDIIILDHAEFYAMYEAPHAAYALAGDVCRAYRRHHEGNAP